MNTTNVNKDEATKLIDNYKLTLYGRNAVRFRRGMKTLAEFHKQCDESEILILALNDALKKVSNEVEMQVFLAGLKTVIAF